MKTSLKRTRGSMILATMISVMIIAVAVGSLMEYVSNSYRNSMRQRKLFQAKSAAENEMEYVFYTWKQTLLANAFATVTDTGMQTIPGLTTATTFNHSGNNFAMSTPEPFLPSMPGVGGNANYTVVRNVQFEPNERRTGLTNGTPRKTGQMSYFVAQATVAYNDPIFGVMNVNVGRRFIYSETSLFQYSVFYQGDIEFSAGSSMTINGDVSSNGNIYLGVLNNGSTLTVHDKVRYAGMFNGDTDPLAGTQRTHYGNNSLLTDATFTDSRANQVEQLHETENFLGGIDVDTAISAHPAAYNADGDTSTISDADRNLVYRAVIAPPPPVAEDPTIAARRMYNRAGLVVKVSTVGGVDTVTAYTQVNGVQTDITSAFTGVTPQIIPTGQVRESNYDYREAMKVKMTTIDVAALKTALQSNSIPALNAAYNGFVYVYDTDPAVTDTVTPANSYKAGVRLKNGSDVPDLDKGLVSGGSATGEYTGFTVATDNGLYVQGNYNTVPASTTPLTPRSAALLGDAVTVLSDNWQNDTTYNAGTGLGARPAATMTATANTLDNNNYTTIVAAIVSGNTPSTSTTNVSGGVQNLVRYLENWSVSNQSVKLFGSLGQLFTSTYFNSAYKNSGYGPNVYAPPVARDLTFDENLAKNPKGGWPSTTNFYRGDYFTW